MYRNIRLGRRLVASGLLTLCLSAADAAAQQSPVDDSRTDIDEITVSATPLSRTVEQLAQPTSVLAGEQLALMQSTSIGETLSGEPGITREPKVYTSARLRSDGGHGS